MSSEQHHDAEREPLRRTWPQRLLIVAVSLASVGSLAAAGLVWFAQQQLENRVLVVIDQPTEVATAGATAEEATSGGADGAADDASDDNGGDPVDTADPNVPVETKRDVQ